MGGIMHARSTTVTAEPSTIDRGIRYVQDELLPELMTIDGCVGLSLLIDHSTGRCIATTAWETEQAMRASADEVRPLRDHLVVTFGSSSAEVDEWEVAIMHRDHQSTAGARARASWFQVDPKAVGTSTEAFRAQLPAIEDLPGFCSTSLLTNAESGRAVSTTVFDSAEAIVQTRGQANGLRSRLAEQAGAEVIEVAEFELAVAHLRVPEMA
jgi:heme-degrading monooxygenase HmoA